MILKMHLTLQRHLTDLTLDPISFFDVGQMLLLEMLRQVIYSVSLIPFSVNNILLVDSNIYVSGLEYTEYKTGLLVRVHRFDCSLPQVIKRLRIHM